MTADRAQYPFEFAKTRVQLSDGKLPRNPYSIVGDVYRSEGFRALYKGCSTLVLVRRPFTMPLLGLSLP